jgi:DUF4097 and DUF4098 domain-containing protein YvlB
MKAYRWFTLGIPTLAAMAICLSAPARAADGHFDRTLQVTGPVELEVQTGSGTINVRTGDNSNVRVSGTIRASGGWFDGGDQEKKVRYLEAHPPIEQHGNVIKVGHIEDEDLQRNISISYEIVVPVATHLHSSSGSGEQDVSGISGPAEASSGSGSLKLTNIGDTVRVSTGSGHISVEGVKGSVRATTGSGEIRATGVAGALHASTGSGNVMLHQAAPGEVEVSTGSGTVHIEGVHGSVHASTASGDISVEGEGEGSWRLSAASGNVSVRLPSQQGFALHAQTVSGSIHTAREMTVQSTSSGHEIEGKVGAGGFLLDISTVSGSISVD